MSGSVNTCEACGEAFYARGPDAGHVCRYNHEDGPTYAEQQAAQEWVEIERAADLLRARGWTVKEPAR